MGGKRIEVPEYLTRDLLATALKNSLEVGYERAEERDRLREENSHLKDVLSSVIDLIKETMDVE